MVVPVMKKGEGRVVGDYRGVTLMPTLYKVYTSVLAKRLREEVKSKSIVPRAQAGFKKRMGTIDNIYVLNYLVNRQIKRAEKKLVTMVVDLRAAFDTMDRESVGGDNEKEGDKRGVSEEGRRSDKRDKEQDKGRGRDEGEFLDGKRAEIRVPSKPTAVQHSCDRHRGRDREGKVGRGEDRRRESIYDAICG